jgi:hypothetical protein
MARQSNWSIPFIAVLVTSLAMPSLGAEIHAASMPALQDTPPRALPAPTRELPEGFSGVSSVAELSDDLVLVTDFKDGEVFRVRWANGEQEPAARRGRGPLEYAQPGGIYPMRNGESWLIDQTQRRYLVFSAAGRPVRTAPFAAPSGGGMMVSSSDPHRLDGRGREIERERPGRAGPTEFAALTRRAGERVDTIAQLKNPEVVANAATGMRVMMTVRFSPSDGFAITSEGDIAVVRADGYRVEWLLENGRRVAGQNVAYTPLPVTAADREAAEAARASIAIPGGVRITHTDQNGQQRESDPRSLLPEVKLAEQKPAFDANRLYTDREHRLWVGRYTAHGAAEVYDIFDRSGVRVDRVSLPAGFKLVGFGERKIYVVREDGDGLQWMGRIPY